MITNVMQELFGKHFAEHELVHFTESEALQLDNILKVYNNGVEPAARGLGVEGAPKEETAGFAAVQLPKGLLKHSSAGQVAQDVADTVNDTLSQKIKAEQKKPAAQKPAPRQQPTRSTEDIAATVGQTLGQNGKPPSPEQLQPKQGLLKNNPPQN